MGEIFLLAVASAFYPLYLAVVIVAFATDSPRRVLAGYLLGALPTLITIGLVIVLAFSGKSFTNGQHSTLSPALDIAVGGLLIVAGLLLRRWKLPEVKPPPTKKGRTERLLGGGSIPLAAGAGVLMNIIPGPGYVVGLKDITVGGYSTAGQVALIVGFNLIQLSLIEIPFLSSLVAPDRTGEFADRFNLWLRRKGPLLLAALAALLGLYLIGRGIFLLAT